MLLKIVFGLSLLILHQFCYCEEHIYGTSNGGDKLLFEKVIFDQYKDENAIKTKNYTVIFKYIGSETSTNITNAVFDVKNANKSYSTITVDAEKGKEKSLQAMLNIINGTNVQVTAKIYGPSANLFVGDTFQQFANLRPTIPKTMTVVYAHNGTQTRNRKVILGHRQPGDHLIQFESKNVTFKYKFAESEFKYYNERQFVTAVGFSFESATATAFLNSTFITDHGIDAIVYDWNEPIFVANMSVYGFEQFEKPASFKPIILSNKNKY